MGFLDTFFTSATVLRCLCISGPLHWCLNGHQGGQASTRRVGRWARPRGDVGTGCCTASALHWLWCSVAERWPCDVLWGLEPHDLQALQECWRLESSQFFQCMMFYVYIYINLYIYINMCVCACVCVCVRVCVCVYYWNSHLSSSFWVLSELGWKEWWERNQGT